MRPAAYGQVFGSENIVAFSVAASQPIQANGGKFVWLNSAENVELASATCTTDFFGWACVGGSFSTSSTAGADTLPVNVAQDAVYEMPISATASLTEAGMKSYLGKVCGVQTTSGLQYCDYATATDKTLLIVGYKYYGSKLGEQSFLVKPTFSVLSGIHTATA